LYFLGYQGWFIVTLDNDILLEGFGAAYGMVEDAHSYRAEIGGNIATFSILNIIRLVYGPPLTSIEHVRDNQSAITDTWKEDTVGVFEKTKSDAVVIIVARSAITELQQFSAVRAFWIGSHTDKRDPPYTLQEELTIKTATLAERAQTDILDELIPRHDALHFPEQQISVVVSHKKFTSRLPLHISTTIHGPTLRMYTFHKEG
jgi:hypothetical protein